MLDLCCGKGGWTKGFLPLGFRCIGVDVVDLGYPGELIVCDLLQYDPTVIRGGKNCLCLSTLR